MLPTGKVLVAGGFNTSDTGPTTELFDPASVVATPALLTPPMKLQTGEEGKELEERVLGPGDSFHVTPLLRHRMVAQTDCDILEASTPELDDVVRLEDWYGRVK